MIRRPALKQALYGRSKPKPISVWQGYDPVGHQKAFHESTARYRLMKGGYGSGKTYACCKEVLALATRHSGNRFLVGRKYFRVLKDTTYRTFLDAIAPVRHALVQSESQHELVLKTQDGGQSSVLFMGLDDPQKLRSLEIGGFFVDEASELPEETFLTLVARMRLAGVRRRRGLFATNPTSKQHWIYQRFVQNPGQEYALFNSTSYDNPHLGKAVIQSMETAYAKADKERLMLGEWGLERKGQPVFGAFSRSRHIAPFTALKDIPLVVGWDFGFRRPAAVIGQMQEGSLVILDAELGQDESLDRFTDRVLFRLRDLAPDQEHRHFGDVAGRQRNQVTGDSCVARLAERGVLIATTPQRIQDGLLVIRARLENLTGKHFGLMFSDRCHEEMIDAMNGGYAYSDGATFGADPLPCKDGRYDHLVDALRYLVVGLFGPTGSRSYQSSDLLANFLDQRVG